jgi:hypothetical protein
MFESLIETKQPNWKLRFVSSVVIVVLGAGVVSLWRMTQMPLSSYRGPLPGLNASQSELAARLAGHVRYLSKTVGERNIPHEGSLNKTTEYLRTQLTMQGYLVQEQTYSIDGHMVSNIEAQLGGASPGEGSIVVGAHYDSADGTVGADDNASGVAALLELAGMMRHVKLHRTVQYVFFVNEEPPYFQTSGMGSLVYARKLHDERSPVAAMISLETVGFYSDIAGSQKYPAIFSVFYPSRGNFIGFVANTESRDLVRRAVRTFREAAQFPSEGVAAPSSVPGIGWSDHWSFWQFGYPAIMVTDTAPFRYPYYHRTGDTSEKIDSGRMARVVDGLRTVISSLANQ